jgi:hypothetical protein
MVTLVGPLFWLTVTDCGWKEQVAVGVGLWQAICKVPV